MSNLSTPDLCDQFPKQVSVLDPVYKSFGGNESFCGEVVTVKCFEDNSKVKQLVDTDGTGKVMVVDAGGSMRRACLGDMLAEKAQNNGWAGIIIYGCVRDVEILKTLNIGVQALGSHPMKTDKRGLGDINIPLQFSGVTVIPGNYIYADLNGIIVSDKALVER
ncbi:ribonuclease E activity regulator RraA [Pelagibaculum spongiae]|uniref:4-hydroxy-4-methyl-2-oxoglutarate aldolase n=1 Tax=Pelagibaculum spongiae TaxID=2080658 RepID=A0A2V1GSG0_9GAMM|nr:ribonuclease E activity regulator RraA [Pelagibaculum spongiae]PVZ67653.1 putative 4-hydroxy-4-methyl-2-oxoglutarate aldolase [Pelagibaculum spongiae]